MEGITMRSDNVKSGMQQAPHRSLFNALGFTEEETRKYLQYLMVFMEKDRENGVIQTNQ